MSHFVKPFLPTLSPSKHNHESELLHALRYIPNLEHIPSSSTSDDRIRTYDPKTDLEPPNSFGPHGDQFHPPTDITLRGKLDKSSIPALRVIWKPNEIARQRSSRARKLENAST
jgi:hypothetical protein